MSVPCKFERRILSYDEHEIILRTHHPEIYDAALDDLMLVIAENAALEFTGYGHGGPLVSCAAASEDWYYGVILAVSIRWRAILGGRMCHGCQSGTGLAEYTDERYSER